MIDHESHAKREPVETRRETVRKQVVKQLSPGCNVEVVNRVITDDDGRTHMLIKLATWKEVSPAVIKVAKTWRPSSHQIKEMNRLRGPVLAVGAVAMVIAVLPEVECETGKVRPWSLLLTRRGELGWCYALDALQPCSGS